MIKHVVSGTAIFLMAAANAFAQARIVDSEPVGRSQSSSNARSGQTSNNSSVANAAAGQAELYYQVQLLQQEVQDLRGLVEQQSYELKRLQQQRLDDYLDLDRRLGQLGDAKMASVAQPSDTTPLSPTLNTEVTDAAPGDELASYRSAIDLVLKQRDFDGGIEALKSYLAKFPKGHYVANAQYWLGQIYLQREDLAQSRDWFTLMLKAHPSHQKAPEAKYKLGKVYHLLGDSAQAKKILEEVAAANVAVSSLAQDYLKQNF